MPQKQNKPTDYLLRYTSCVLHCLAGVVYGKLARQNYCYLDELKIKYYTILNYSK